MLRFLVINQSPSMERSVILLEGYVLVISQSPSKKRSVIFLMRYALCEDS